MPPLVIAADAISPPAQTLWNAVARRGWMGHQEPWDRGDSDRWGLD